MEVLTKAGASQFESSTKSQPAASYIGVPTFEDFLRHYKELQQVQVGTLSQAKFNRCHTSKVAANQRALVAYSPSVTAQQDPSLPAASELLAGQWAPISQTPSAAVSIHLRSYHCWPLCHPPQLLRLSILLHFCPSTRSRQCCPVITHSIPQPWFVQR